MESCTSVASFCLCPADAGDRMLEGVEASCVELPCFDFLFLLFLSLKADSGKESDANFSNHL
jgi:hypothetical protein